jgi:hypothetical protein
MAIDNARRNKPSSRSRRLRQSAVAIEQNAVAGKCGGTAPGFSGLVREQEENPMSYENTPDGGIAESTDEHHSQPRFLGGLALVLAALAILFAIIVMIAGLTHPGVV